MGTATFKIEWKGEPDYTLVCTVDGKECYRKHKPQGTPHPEAHAHREFHLSRGHSEAPGSYR
jgi:hypothetical protein